MSPIRSHFNGRFGIEIAFAPIEKIIFFENFFTGFLIIIDATESTDLASSQTCNFRSRRRQLCLAELRNIVSVYSARGYVKYLHYLPTLPVLPVYYSITDLPHHVKRY